MIDLLKQAETMAATGASATHIVELIRATLAGKAHPHTDQCGFDRNGSHNAGHYVCMCGWEDAELNAAPQGLQDYVPSDKAERPTGPAGAAPGLPEEPIYYNDMGEFATGYNQQHFLSKIHYDALRTFAIRTVKEREDAWAAVRDVGRTDMEEDEWREEHAATIAAARRGR